MRPAIVDMRDDGNISKILIDSNNGLLRDPYNHAAVALGFKKLQTALLLVHIDQNIAFFDVFCTTGIGHIYVFIFILFICIGSFAHCIVFYKIACSFALELQSINFKHEYNEKLKGEGR